MAHGWEMQHDDSVVVIGQDVGANGGVFRATAGLQARFGKDRVQDTPLAEATIAGMSVGMAAHGLKPVAEIQFMGFMYPALDQIVNHMSRMRNRTRGRLSCPVVIRTPHGGGIHAPEHHSESTETMLCHIPGHSRRVPVLAGARLRLAARGDPRSRSGDVPGAGAAVPGDAPGGERRRPGAAARPLLHPARGQRRHHRDLGRHDHRNAARGGELESRGHQRRGHRSRDLEPDRQRDDPRVGGQDRPARDRARSGPQCRRRRGNRRDRGRARLIRPARADPAGHRLRHHHAAVPARARLHSRACSASSTRCSSR